MAQRLGSVSETPGVPERALALTSLLSLGVVDMVQLAKLPVARLILRRASDTDVRLIERGVVRGIKLDLVAAIKEAVSIDPTCEVRAIFEQATRLVSDPTGVDTECSWPGPPPSVDCDQPLIVRYLSGCPMTDEETAECLTNGRPDPDNMEAWAKVVQGLKACNRLQCGRWLEEATPSVDES